MATYLLTSMYESGFDRTTTEMLNRVIKKKSSIVCIASDFFSYELTDKFWNVFYNMFKSAGLSFEKSAVIDGRLTPSQAQTLVKKADVVWISGGDTIAEFNYIKKYGLDDILKAHQGVLIGMSAGTLNLAKKVILPVCKGHSEQSIYDGLGLVDITVISHYDMGIIPEEILSLSEEYELYLMTDGSYILCTGEQKEFYGNILRIKNREVKTVCSLK